MDRFEQRMHQAAEEVRRTAQTLTPPPNAAPGKTTLPRRGLLVFAAAFATVVIVVGVLPMLGSGNQPGSVASPDTTNPVAPPSTTIPTVVCSSSGTPPPAEVEGLPRQVADIRQAIVEAAQACDFAALVGLAGDRFTTHFGGGGSEMLEVWESEGEGKLDTLLQILDMSHAVQEFAGEAAEVMGSSMLYVWPAAFAYDRWEDVPPEYIDELTAIYTAEELDQIAGFGSYAGWRTGITADGNWVFFVAGD